MARNTHCLGTANAPLGRLLLGNSATGGSLWKGDFLALVLYDRELTPAEIAHGTAAGTLPDPVESDGGLIARYRFDRIQGTIIPNTSGPQYDIIVPPYFSPLRRTILEPPRGGPEPRRWFLKDIVLNILGFMPFGFLAMFILDTATAISPRWQSSLVVLAGFSLSLFVELIQVFLPTRSSSLTDLATNTLGTALGVLLFSILYTWQLEVINEEVAIS